MEASADAERRAAAQLEHLIFREVFRPSMAHVKRERNVRVDLVGCDLSAKAGAFFLYGSGIIDRAAVRKLFQLLRCRQHDCNARLVVHSSGAHDIAVQHKGLAAYQRNVTRLNEFLYLVERKAGIDIKPVRAQIDDILCILWLVRACTNDAGNFFLTVNDDILAFQTQRVIVSDRRESQKSIRHHFCDHEGQLIDMCLKHNAAGRFSLFGENITAASVILVRIRERHEILGKQIRSHLLKP